MPPDTRERKYRLIAEAQAWPLVSPVGFERQLVSLRRDRWLAPAGDSAALADALASRLKEIGRGISLESVDSIRDGAWFCRPEDAGDPAGDSSAEREVGLHEHVAWVARMYLERRGREWVLALPNGEAGRWGRGEQILRWRWLSLSLPVDILIAGACAERGLPAAGDRVSLVSALLRHTLERGVADTHLHLGGAFRFPTLWMALMQQLALKAPPLRLGSGSQGVFGGGGRAQKLLYAAAFARLILARFVGAMDGDPEQVDLSKGLRSALRTFERALPGGASEGRVIEGALELLLDPAGRSAPGAREPSVEQLRWTYAHLIRMSPDPGDLQMLKEADPIRAMFLGSDDVTLAETHLTCAVLSLLFRRARQPAGRDPLLERLFWQYVRVRVWLFRYLTLDQGTVGLDWFVQAYGRLRGLRGRLEPLLTEAACELQGADVTLRSLEVRTSPPETRMELIALIRAVAAVDRGRSRDMERSLTLHFVKKKRDVRGRLEADPQDPTLPNRYARWVRQMQSRASQAAGTLRAYPEALLIWTAVDVAGSELAMPTWPSLIPLHYLRRVSEEVARTLCLRRPDWDVGPLKLTMHAGEDFRRLVEGVRRMHEALEYGPLRPGDRIGHGVALFVKPSRWAGRAQHVMQPRDDRLDDLLWEYERYLRGDLVPEPGRPERVQSEAWRLPRPSTERRSGLSVDCPPSWRRDAGGTSPCGSSGWATRTACVSLRTRPARLWCST